MPVRRLAAALLGAALLLAGLPVLPAAAKGPVSIVAREVRTSVERERVVELPIDASHVALHWRGRPDAKVRVAFGADRATFRPQAAVLLDEVGEARGNGETYGAAARRRRSLRSGHLRPAAAAIDGARTG
jgi:hypothetical protein